MGNYILIGVVGNHYGFSGEFNFKIEYSEIRELPQGFKVRVGYSANFAEDFIIERFERKNSRAIAKFQGINDKESILKHKEKGIFADEDEILKYNPKFISTNKIIGCIVVDAATGQKIGEITEVWELPANNVWLAKTEVGDLPIPVIDEVIIETDFENKIVKINVIDGLLDLTHGRGVVDED